MSFVAPFAASSTAQIFGAGGGFAGNSASSADETLRTVEDDVAVCVFSARVGNVDSYMVNATTTKKQTNINQTFDKDAKIKETNLCQKSE